MIDATRSHDKNWISGGVSSHGVLLYATNDVGDSDLKLQFLTNNDSCVSCHFVFLTAAMAPLRDRPPSNTTEPEWPPQPVTPLRIAKRDTQQRPHVSQLSRRSSNTFAKLTRSNLVSQSPFRSQPSSAPAPSPSRPSSVLHSPSPRRVSGEKRPRPDSMQSHVENERPLGFKRRQSKGFQDLIEKEPVKKSPFLHPASPIEDPFPPPPPPPKVLHTSHLP